MHGPWIVQDRSTHGCHRDPLATMLPISYCQPADLARKELYGLISSEVVAEHGKDFAITMNGPLLAANPAGLQWDPAMTWIRSAIEVVGRQQIICPTLANSKDAWIVSLVPWQSSLTVNAGQIPWLAADAIIINRGLFNCVACVLMVFLKLGFDYMKTQEKVFQPSLFSSCSICHHCWDIFGSNCSILVLNTSIIN